MVADYPLELPAVMPSVDLVSYQEDEDYLSQQKPEPKTRSQTLIYQHNRNRWWIRVTLIGSACSTLILNDIPRSSKRSRREEFKDFVRLINFETLPLLQDTVTEMILGKDLEATATIPLNNEADVSMNGIAMSSRNLKYKIREDPSRVNYPPCQDFPSFRRFDARELIDRKEIVDGVFRVIHHGVPYILKVVNRPLYQPPDTEVLRQELENLKQFQGIPNIGQAAGIAVDSNPYSTSMTVVPTQVVIGILLKFYSGGSLQQVFDRNNLQIYSWEQWPLQIALALGCLHRAGKTHMDIKPSNVVLDSSGNAILIDISGIGGITRAWCAPEIQDQLSPFELSFNLREWSDVWAYGRLLLEITKHAKQGPYVKHLKSIADKLMNEEIPKRMSLSDAILQLGPPAHGTGV